MHPCLAIYDILERICYILREDDDIDALAQLARTCTTFLEPALNELWHSIPSLEPLIKCLPEDAWMIKPTRYESVLSLRRKTTPKDWERCKYYAHRIRRFGPVEFESSEPLGQIKGALATDRSVFEALQPLPFPSEPSDPELGYDLGLCAASPLLVLPKLQYCRLTPNGATPIPHFQPFLSPTLRELEFTSPAYDPEELLPGILKAVARASPYLRSLRIEGVSVIPPFSLKKSSATLTNMLPNLVQLEVLICPRLVFPKDAVRYLASKLALKSLHIRNDVEQISEWLEDIAEPCFQHLRRLSLECTDMLHVANLLDRKVTSRNIEYLEVSRNEGIPTERELGTFLRTVAKHVPSSILQTLYVHQDLNTGFGNKSWQSGEYTVHMGTLEPLLGFSRLEACNLIFDCRFTFDNGDLERIAQAWPRLKVLQFGFPGGGWGTQPRITLDGLLHLAKNCSSLQILGICMNATTVQTPDENGKYAVGVKCSSLRFLDVGDSVFDDPRCVASYLVDVFPELQGVYGPDVWISSVWQKKWTNVSRLVTELSSNERTRPRTPSIPRARI